MPADAREATHTRSTVPDVQRAAVGRILVAAVIGGLFMAGCAASESSRIGACPIHPGAACSGNYMRGAKLAGAGLFDAEFDHADLTGVDLVGADLSGATMTDAHLNRAAPARCHPQLCRPHRRRPHRRQPHRRRPHRRQPHRRAVVTPRQSREAKLCRTTLPDGTVAAPDC